MSDTNFVAGTPIVHQWLNDVNDYVYNGIPPTTNPAWVSVLSFGADPTGVVDSTVAFNLATQASASWSTALEYNIIVPSGHYKINGTVYVRKGQTLQGTGTGTYINCTGTPTNTNNFVIGGNSGGADAGGSPVRIANLWTSGGGATAGVIKSIAAGFFIDNMFMTFPGIGIDCTNCSDGVISNIQIDQCLTGFLFNGSQNIQISNFDIYIPNYAVQINGACNAITFGTGIIEYPQFAGILGATGVSNIKSLSFNNVNFIMNTQYGTFNGYLNWQASSSDVSFTGCTFRNMFNYAINHNSGTNNNFTFTGCIFDGSRSSASYTSSTTAKGIFGVSGGLSTYDFTGCEFRNLLGEIFALNSGCTLLKIHGGAVINCPQTRLNIAATDVPKVSIKGVTDFPYVLNTGTAQAVVLPYWGASTAWKVGIKGNTNSSGSPFYAASEESAVCVSYQFASSGNTYVDKMLIWQTPTRAVPGNLTSAVCFGTAAGGATSQVGVVMTGNICISVATTSANNFNWTADTLI